MLVGVSGIVDGGVQRGGLFFARLLLHHGGVDDLGTLGFGHYAGGGGRAALVGNLKRLCRDFKVEEYGAVRRRSHGIKDEIIAGADDRVHCVIEQ
nr:hypothetical protein CFP56_66497 [Quercus suber]